VNQHQMLVVPVTMLEMDAPGKMHKVVPIKSPSWRVNRSIEGTHVTQSVHRNDAHSSTGLVTTVITTSSATH